MRVWLILALIPTLLGFPGRSAAQSASQTRNATPAFSITLSTRQTVVEVGSPLRVRIADTNMLDRDIFVALPIQMSVLDGEGKPVPETAHWRKTHGTEPRPTAPPGVGGIPVGIPGPSGSVIGPRPMHPGETTSGISGDLTKQYDLSTPGTYTIQARRRDSYSESVVESNVLTVTVIAPSQAPERPTTSFTLAIRTDEDTVKAGNKIPVNIEVTNTSDHLIVYTPSITTLDIQVHDAQGKMAPLTEAGRELRREYGSIGINSHFSLSPGDSWPAGGVGVGVLYDLSRPGDYTIQISQFDDETKTWVKSNTITVTVTP